VVTAQGVLDAGASIVHVVPLTSRIRNYVAEVQIEPDIANGLEFASAAQCHQIRSVSLRRVERRIGHVGPVLLAEVRQVIALLLDATA